MQVLLSIIVAVEAVAISALVSEATRLNRVVAQPQQDKTDERTGYPLHGQPAPAFRAPLLGRSNEVSNADLVGRTNMMLFLSPDAIKGMPFSVLKGIVQGLWSKVDGTLYIVFEGDEAGASKLCAELELHNNNVLDVEVIVDRDLGLHELFGVAKRPSGVLLDSRGHIERYGESVRRSASGQSASALAVPG